MLIFGHAGVTLGTAVLLGTLLRDRVPSARKAEAKRKTGSGGSRSGSGLEAVGRFVDLRLLLVGSLLPDIIDKPLGQVILRDVYQNGRIFAHTLLFLLALTALGLFLYRRRAGTGALALAFGSLMHLAEDQMWLSPRTLLWPLYGFSFPGIDLDVWVPGILYALFHNPAVYVPELLGLGVVGWFVWHLWHRRRLFPFLLKGRL